jgi:adenylyltransferase/sulfurtransferase
VDRYIRQIALTRLGADAQRRLQSARACVVGLGATGSAIAALLVRAGVGHVRVIDRDIVEVHNLQRQRLYTDADAAAGRPKAIAAADHLRAVNPEVVVDERLADLTPGNARELLDGVDCVLDGTDNFETRLLMNDVCVERGVPWVYAGVIGTHGHTMAIVPGRTACFRCYVPEAPPPGSTDTCESAGVLGPAVDVVSGFAATEGLKLLAGLEDALVTTLLVTDVWTREVRQLRVDRDPACPCCGARRFEFLAGGAGTGGEALCGRDAVHLRAAPAVALDLAALSDRVRRMGAEQVIAADRLLRFGAEGLEVSLFPDGRAIVRGTGDVGRARSLYARWLGG